MNYESLNHPRRNYLLAVLDKYQPFNEVFEFGCGVGSNLFLIARKYPKVMCYGYDINKKAIEIGEREILKSRIRNIELYSDATKLGKDFLDETIIPDIVISDAVMIYFPPGRAKKELRGLTEIAQRAIILYEWHGEESMFAGHWIHNYEEILPGCKITRIDEDTWTDPGWQEYGALIEWRKNGALPLED